MATRIRKRKALESLEESAKRLRIDQSNSEEPTLPAEDNDGLDNHEKDSYQGSQGSQDSRDGSVDSNAVNTPVTPFSPAPTPCPGRKRFPSEFKTIKCTYEGCEKTFNRPARLQSHLRTHTNERPYICSYEDCGKSYIEDKHLQQHIKGSHTQERSYECDWEGCNKSFLTGTRLRRHKEAHGGHDRFRCTAYPPCNQTFRKHQTLQRHIRSDHLELAPFPCIYVNPVTGVACNAGFDGSVGLKKHEDREHSAPQFICDSCVIPGTFSPDGTQKSLGFSTKFKLQSHIRKEHANCMFCDLKCSSQRELQKHIERQHSGKSIKERKTIACSEPGCLKKFTTRSNLAAHIRISHNGERFICGTFDISSNPGVQAFNFEEDGCGCEFVSKVNLIDHIRIAHLGLPSLINANRPEASSLDLDFDTNCRSVKKSKKAKKQKPKPNAIDELVGNSYAVDPTRNIPCVVPGCPYKFIRTYDLDIHMQAVHGSRPTSHGSDFAPNSFTETASRAFPQSQPEMELQQQSMQGSPFWVGAGEFSTPQTPAGDSWIQEEAEMRTLIDNGGVNHYIQNGGLIDPNLL